MEDIQLHLTVINTYHYVRREYISNVPDIYKDKLLFIKIEHKYSVENPCRAKHVLIADDGQFSYGYHFFTNLTDEDCTFLTLAGVFLIKNIVEKDSLLINEVLANGFAYTDDMAW